MIRFELRAEIRPDGRMPVKEWYVFERPAGPNGEHPIKLEGLVDEDIKKQNAKEYLAFRAEVEADENAAWAKARDAAKERKG